MILKLRAKNYTIELSPKWNLIEKAWKENFLKID